MLSLIHFTIALISLIAIVLSCIIFTNVIEFLGNKLKLGNNATGSILAVIGTGLPETIVPIVAILSTTFSDIKIETAQGIALGAIIGSPFMLSTLALFLLAIILLVKKRNSLNIASEMIFRDYKYFLLAYSIAILFAHEFLSNFKIIAIILLIFLYAFFVYRTVIKSRITCIECECENLYFSKLKINENIAIFFQLLLSLSILIASSHFFVNEIKYFSEIYNTSPVILALIITPFATELPEIINSIIWLKQNKDELAIANILGAVIFQTTILFALGMILTNWIFTKPIVLNVFTTYLCAFIFINSILVYKKIKIKSLILCGIFYFIYVIFILTK